MPGAAQAPTPAHIRETVAKNLSFSLTVLSAGARHVTLIGTIDDAMAEQFKAAVAADSHVDTVVVDSYGGNIASALDIADVIRKRNMHIVVDGRCLSACASYLFSAAATKTVLPGSVVAIHGLTFNYLDGAKVVHVTESQAGELFRTSTMAGNREFFDRQMARQNEFYRQLGVRGDLRDTFARYLAHRKQLLGTDMITAQQHAPGCPPAQMWALDKAQLEASGVRGIGAFWTPSSDEQKAQLLRDLGLPADFLYYGPAAGLEQLCTLPPGRIAAMKQWLARTFTR
ncbi:hypothetical protein RugamoR64_11960 [Duganella rhizosphaerae]